MSHCCPKSILEANWAPTLLVLLRSSAAHDDPAPTAALGPSAPPSGVDLRLGLRLWR